MGSLGDYSFRYPIALQESFIWCESRAHLHDSESRAYLHVIVSHVADVHSAGCPTSSFPASYVLAVA